MSTQMILNLMDYWSHCHECGAQLVTVKGGAICPHCGFELEDPDEGEVIAFRNARAEGRVREDEEFWSSDDRPQLPCDEAA